MTTKRAAVMLIVMIGGLILFNPAKLFVIYMIGLGWAFWSFTLPICSVFVHGVLQVHTGRGLIYWICRGGIILDGVLCGIPGWLADGASAFWHMAKSEARRVEGL